MVLINPVPYFSSPPAEYDQRYFAQLIRAFSVYVQQASNPGALRATELTLTSSGGNVTQGGLSWNATDEALDLTLGNEVTQQVGFDSFVRCKNSTGGTITKGTAVRLSSVSGGEILIAKFVADGVLRPEAYYLGIAAFDMADGDSGPVQVYGRMHDVDTSGTPYSQTWAAGEFVYVSPSTAGNLTNVRPSATVPSVVLAGIVLTAHATTGQMLVRTAHTLTGAALAAPTGVSIVGSVGTVTVTTTP